MKKARKEYYTNFIQDNRHNPRKLFRSAKTLFSYKPSKLNFQGYYDNRQLANATGDFFVQKIEVSRAKLDAAASDVSTSDEFHPADFVPLTSCFDSFHLVTEEDVRTLISKSNKKSCSQDPMPIQIVVECLDVLLPALTRMINLSLESGCFNESWKHADVHPRLKKPKSKATFPNLRPISNLTFVS